jgi:hypothetical protein
MFSPRIIVGVCILVFALSAAAAEADPAHRGRGRARGGPHGVFVAPHAAQPVFVARPFRRFGPGLGYRPVYRPGLSVGIFIGSPYRYRYPYAYRYRSPFPYYPYGYAYPSPYPYAYSYPAPAAVYAVPPAGALYGGVRLQVTPNDAMVYVDGYYAGTVDDFDGSLQRVALEPGPHHFEIQAPGYATLAFNVNVRPTETIRYRADMQPLP